MASLGNATAVTLARDLTHIQSSCRAATLSVPNMIWITRGSSRWPHAGGITGDSAAMSVLQGCGHLFRFAGLFVLAFIIFLVVRHYVVPQELRAVRALSRRSAIGEIAARPGQVRRARDMRDLPHGRAGCEEQRQACACELRGVPWPAWRTMRTIRASVTPVKPDTAVLCARCHTASAAKPKGFPQVDPRITPTALPCETCHQPHSPAIDETSSRQQRCEVNLSRRHFLVSDACCCDRLEVRAGRNAGAGCELQDV